jgi:uncharacterized surface protein with fasciclin (FAS1) repeats
MMLKKHMAGVVLAAISVTAIVPATVSAAPGTTIVDKAIAVNSRTGSFDTLLTAATCPALGGAVVDVLSSPNKTLFAPTDAAFRRLGSDLGLGKAGLTSGNVCTVDSLLGEGTLLDVLAYHVIDGKVDAKAATKAVGSKVGMVNGDKTAITVRGGKLRIDDAVILATDVRASDQGLIHVIQKVMLPPSLG